MGRVETIPLSFRSPPLSLNLRKHWAPAHRIIGAIHDEIKIRTHRWEPFTSPVEVELLWLVFDRRIRDVDNPMPTCKYLVDGLVLAGVLPRDDSTFVRRSFCTIERVPKPLNRTPTAGATQNHMKLIIREIG